MAIYDYRCPGCDHEFEVSCPLSEWDKPRECPQCSHSPATKIFKSAPSVVLKGDGWAGKNLRIKSQMEKKNRDLDKRMEDRKRDAHVRLAPNVDGERVGSWSEAKQLAKDKGKNTSTYEPYVRKEKST